MNANARTDRIASMSVPCGQDKRREKKNQTDANPRMTVVHGMALAVCVVCIAVQYSTNLLWRPAKCSLLREVAVSIFRTPFILEPSPYREKPGGKPGLCWLGSGLYSASCCGSPVATVRRSVPCVMSVRIRAYFT